MDVYEIVTSKIIEKLEQGIIPWVKPWAGGNPKNFHTGKEYHGVNILLLSMQGYGSPYWLTFNQVKARKGHVNAGSKGTPVIYWNVKEVECMDENEDEEPILGLKKEMILRYYTVFNIEQTSLPVPKIGERTFKPIEECERIVSGYKNAPRLQHGKARAYYSPVEDYINLPAKDIFNSDEEYYSTLFHEMVHSTGHGSRLNRLGKGNGSFGSEEYSQEELIAEIGSAFLCTQTGIEKKTLDNSTGYIQSWLKRLRNDKKLIVIASAQGEKAVKHIRGLT